MALPPPRSPPAQVQQHHPAPPPEHNQQQAAASSQQQAPLQLSCGGQAYTPCYCEENVWRLLQALLLQQQQMPACTPAAQLFAVFVSNANESVPLWCQRASQDPSQGLVVWDYHVIALEVPPAAAAAARVWDLDLQPDHPQLPFPCSLAAYAQHVLRAGEGQLVLQFQRRMRLVPARVLLQRFASDRSHMRRPDGTWSAPPPPQPCIVAQDGSSTMNLGRYRDMRADVLPPDAVSGWRDVVAAASAASPFGVVVDEETLLRCLLPRRR